MCAPPHDLEEFEAKVKKETDYLQDTMGDIFVSIISYRDTECQWTIKDLYAKAKTPKRVFVGVCHQYNPEEDQDCFIHEPDRDGATRPRVSSLWVHYTEARGPCYARALVQDLWKNQKYYLQIDSHMRFVQDWDEKMIMALSDCEKLAGHSRVLLSSYPPNYELPNHIHHKNATVLCATHFGEDGFLRISGKTLMAKPKEPVPSLFIAAGFIFAPSKLIDEVPYDPRLKCLFFGEEISLAARLWTCGWDFFSPNESLIYHLWSRNHRPSFRELRNEEHINLEKQSQQIVRNLLAGKEDSPLYGLGVIRTLEDFCTFCDIDFEGQKIGQVALDGGVNSSLFENNNFDLVMKLVQRKTKDEVELKGSDILML